MACFNLEWVNANEFATALTSLYFSKTLAQHLKIVFWKKRMEIPPMSLISSRSSTILDPFVNLALRPILFTFLFIIYTIQVI